MTPVIILSPFSAPTPQGVTKHKAYLALAMLHALVEHGESPYASHDGLTRILRDSVPAQRALGLRAGRAMMRTIPNVRIYSDFPDSPGMVGDIEAAHAEACTLARRFLFAPEDRPPTYTAILEKIDDLQARIA